MQPVCPPISPYLSPRSSSEVQVAPQGRLKYHAHRRLRRASFTAPFHACVVGGHVVLRIIDLPGCFCLLSSGLYMHLQLKRGAQTHTLGRETGVVSWCNLANPVAGAPVLVHRGAWKMSRKDLVCLWLLLASARVDVPSRELGCMACSAEPGCYLKEACSRVEITVEGGSAGRNCSPGVFAGGSPSGSPNGSPRGSSPGGQLPRAWPAFTSD